MKRFNIYYGYQKINKSPISENEKEKITQEKYIYKDQGQGFKEKILTKNLKFIKCTVI